MWLCQCDCGNVLSVRTHGLRSGNTKSCGCLCADRTCAASIKHRDSSSKEYHIWNGMMQRCYYPSYSSYKYYGARGITVCDRWHSYELFLSDMGRAPSPDHSIDRENNDKGYSPSNCRWATDVEQANNRRNTIRINLNGEVKTLKQWCAHLNLRYNTVEGRLRRGWTAQQALTR